MSPSAWISKACRDKAIGDFRSTSTPVADATAAENYEAAQAAAEVPNLHGATAELREAR
ncbi:hypothetical protein ACFXHA_00315 [Nocardia sp. NPDC059240]|uniref:hypothetical protein n=1 Tax=Nocardia sp. NPDC059240 TaxID=3346786 RepID=UPI0036CD16C6